MARREYFNDPGAPAANSIVVAATAFVQDESGRILLVRRSDNGLWAMPGGGMDVGERVSDAAVRETREETGYDVEVVDLIGVYSDPAHVMAYDDGEIRQQFALSFRCRLLEGAAQTSSETPELRWVAVDELDHLNIHPSIRLRIDHGLSGGALFIG
ncbi:NUDIX domain-containing protein [Angustibacter peucedani]